MSGRLVVALLGLLVLCACGRPSFIDRPEEAWAALRDSGDATREAAAEAIARTRFAAPTEEDALALVRAAADEDPWVRRWAVAALGRGLVPAGIAVPALLGAMNDEMPGVREAAVRALGEIGPEAAPATDALVGALSSETVPVAGTAAWALAAIGKPARDAAIPALLRAEAEGGRALAYLAWHARRVLDMVLPVIGTDPQTTPRFRGERVEIRVDHRGRLEYRGRTLTLSGFVHHLRTRSVHRLSGDDPDDSRVSLNLALDEDLPWAVAQALMATCAHVDIRIGRFDLAARKKEHGFVTHLMWSLPWDSMFAFADGTLLDLSLHARIRLLWNGPPHDPARLEKMLGKAPEGAKTPTVGLQVEPSVSVGDVARVFAAVQSAGYEIIFLDAPPENGRPASLTELTKTVRPPRKGRPAMQCFRIRPMDRGDE